MNCQQALRLFYEVLDNEASQVSTEEFRQHLDKCRPCLEHFQFEEAFQEFVVKRAAGTDTAPSLEKLKMRVLEGLDSADIEQSASAARASASTSLFSMNRLLALAASLILVIGAAYIGRGLYDHSVMYVPLEQAHWNLEQGMSAYQDNAMTASSLTTASENYGYNLLPQVAGFDLLGGRVEEIMGVQMGHFVYTMNGKTVSVFVAPAGEFDIPEDLYREARLTTADVDYYDHRCRGCRLVYHRAGNAVIVTGTTDDDVELLEFIPGTAVI